MVCSMGVSPIGHRTAQGSLYGKGCTIIYAIHSFFLLLAPISNISDDTLQSLSAFPTGNITDQHLLVQNSLKIHFFSSKYRTTLHFSCPCIKCTRPLYDQVVFTWIAYKYQENTLSASNHQEILSICHSSLLTNTLLRAAVQVCISHQYFPHLY